MVFFLLRHPSFSHHWIAGSPPPPRLPYPPFLSSPLVVGLLNGGGLRSLSSPFPLTSPLLAPLLLLVLPLALAAPPPPPPPPLTMSSISRYKLEFVLVPPPPPTPFGISGGFLGLRRDCIPRFPVPELMVAAMDLRAPARDLGGGSSSLDLRRCSTLLCDAKDVDDEDGASRPLPLEGLTAGSRDGLR